jgi:hypothetical protein
MRGSIVFRSFLAVRRLLGLLVVYVEFTTSFREEHKLTLRQDPRIWYRAHAWRSWAAGMAVDFHPCMYYTLYNPLNCMYTKV